MINLNWASIYCRIRLLLLVVGILSIESFVPSSNSIRSLRSIRNNDEVKIRRSESFSKKDFYQSTSYLSMAKKKKKKKDSGTAGKGFGNTNDLQQTETPPKTSSPSPSSSSDFQQQIQAPAPINEGQRALQAMRRERVEKKDAELRKVKELVETDQYVKETGLGAAVIPEKVAQRMGKRMLPFVGVPIFGVMGTFVAFWYFATYKDLQFQTGLVATTTIVVLLLGLLGITYSVMSASWDPEREGSLLGFDEFQRNVDNIKGGLSRSKENLIIRERMAGIPEEEINRAVKDLDRRDAKKLQKQQSLSEKLDLD